MAFDDIITESTEKPRTVVTVSVEVEIHSPYDEQSEEAIEFIATNTAAKQLWRRLFDEHPGFRDLLVEELVDDIGMCPKNSTWLDIVDKLLTKIFS